MGKEKKVKNGKLWNAREDWQNEEERKKERKK